MQRLIQEGLEAGALGLSITRNRGHFDLEGRRIAGACAPEDELFAVTDVLQQVGTGVIQCGGGGAAEINGRLMSRLSAACGRRIMYNTITQNAREPGQWADHLANVHIEDMRARVHEHLMFGEGEIDFPPIIAALAEIRYSGLLSVELSRHSHEAPMAARHAYNYLRPLIYEVSGARCQASGNPARDIRNPTPDT